MRNGKAFVDSLRDDRAVYLDGARVADVTTHPAFAEPIRQIATMYDLAREQWDPLATTYAEPDSGQRTSAMWLIPAPRPIWAGVANCIARGPSVPEG